MQTLESKVYTREQAASYLGLKPQTLAWWACQGTGPAFVRYGRAVRYHRDDLDAFMKSKRVQTTESRPDGRFTMEA